MQLNKPRIDEIRQNFVTLNQQRLQRTLEQLRSRQSEIIDLLPYLFHINSPKLPGYIDQETPCSIANYRPSEEVNKLVHKTFGTVQANQVRGMRQSEAIEGLYIMGSCGSLAFSKSSDFDIWLCHRDGLNDRQLEALQQKACAIEKWAEDKHLEVHFFLMNANDFRTGAVNELSSESSGSTQHELLLDEFYRTSVWLAGKQPLWWFIPVEQDKNYEQVGQQLFADHLLNSEAIIDFGGIAEIPLHEFFGASVWQVYKSIDSPYKSILKITLMEAYTNPKARLLSQQLKEEVQKGNIDVDKLDPYLMMLNYLEQHIAKQDAPLRQELIRRSFYVKLNLPLSTPVHKETWRHETVRKLVSDWGWSQSTISTLDQRNEWGVFEVLSERKLLAEHLTKSYLFLSDFARKNATENSINDRDLTILGRKLYAALERKPGKLDVFARGINTNISEDCVTIILIINRDNQPRWLLYRGKVTPEERQTQTIIKQCSSLIELLTWCYINQVISKSSQILAYAQAAGLTSADLMSLQKNIALVTPNLEQLSVSSKSFGSTPFIKQAALFINCNIPPRAAYSDRIKGVISGSTDVLHFGQLDDSLISSLDFLYTNSWGEAYVQSYQGISGVAEWMQDYATWRQANTTHKQDMPELKMFCNTPHIGKRIISRIQGLLEQFENSLLTKDENFHPHSGFIFEAAKQSYLIVHNDGKTTQQHFASSHELISELKHESLSERQLTLEVQSLQQTLLRPIIEEARGGAIQVYYLMRDERVVFYTVDDLNSIHTQQVHASIAKPFILHYFYFLRHYLLNKLFPKRPVTEQLNLFRKQPSDLLSFSHLKKEPLEFVTRQQSADALAGLAHSEIVDATGAVKNRRKVFSFQCGERKFSSAEHGNEVFAEAAKHCPRHKGFTFISSLRLGKSLVGLSKEQHIPLFQYIKYKKVLEDKLRAELIRRIKASTPSP
jgi:adenylate cyclase class 1